MLETDNIIELNGRKFRILDIRWLEAREEWFALCEFYWPTPNGDWHKVKNMDTMIRVGEFYRENDPKPF